MIEFFIQLITKALQIESWPIERNGITSNEPIGVGEVCTRAFGLPI
jgi:hypothetical protein